MKPTVALDVRMLEHSGIGTYAKNLARGLVRQGTGSADLRVHFYGPPLLMVRHLADVPAEERKKFSAPIYSIREHFEYALLKKQWDLWHCPHYNIPWAKKGRLVVTVHDLIHLVFQGRFFNPLQGWYARQFLSRIRTQADAVIAVSCHTKKDLVERAGIPEEKIAVVYEGVSPEFRPLGDEACLINLKKKYRLSEPFLLYVGNIKPHKNVGQLVRVFRDLKRRKQIDGNLVLVGRPDEKYIARDKDLSGAIGESSVQFITGATLEELPGLYNLARAVVLPSLYEGFGLVVPEAMACGTPVVVSNRASLPEIAGNAAEIFDPDHDDALSRAIEKVIGDQVRRDQLIELGLKRAGQFNWDNTVRETVQVYEKVLRGGM